MSTDPILPAIAAAESAAEGLTIALRATGRNDPSALRRADEAADADADARKALSAIRPTSLEGLFALIRFHAAEAAAMEPETFAALALRDLARAVEAEPRPG